MWKRALSPSPETVSIPVIPSMMPIKNGQAFLNPKFNPVASRIVLFGPGVIDVVMAKREIERTSDNSKILQLVDAHNLAAICC